MQQNTHTRVDVYTFWSLARVLICFFYTWTCSDCSFLSSTSAQMLPMLW